MSEATKKRNKYNDHIIGILEMKHSCSYDFIIKALRGDRGSDKAILIAKEYNQMERAATQAIENTFEKINQ